MDSKLTVQMLLARAQRAQREAPGEEALGRELGRWQALTMAILRPRAWAERHGFEDHNRTVWSHCDRDDSRLQTWRSESLRLLALAALLYVSSCALVAFVSHLAWGGIAARHTMMAATIGFSLFVVLSICDRISSAVAVGALGSLPIALGVAITQLAGIHFGGAAGGVAAGVLLVTLAHFRERSSPRVGFELAPFPEVHGAVVVVGTLLGAAVGYGLTRAGFGVPQVGKHLTGAAVGCYFTFGFERCFAELGWASFDPTWRALIGATAGLVASGSGLIAGRRRWQAWSRARERAPLTGNFVFVALFSGVGAALAYFLPERAGTLAEGASVGTFVGLLVASLYLVPTALFGGRLSDRRVSWLGVASVYAVIGALLPMLAKLPNLRHEVDLIAVSAVLGGVLTVPVLRYLHGSDRRFGICLGVSAGLAILVLATASRTVSAAPPPTMPQAPPIGVEDGDDHPAPGAGQVGPKPSEPEQPKDPVAEEVERLLGVPDDQLLSEWLVAPPGVRQRMAREHPKSVVHVGTLFCRNRPKDPVCRFRRVAEARGRWNGAHGFAGHECNLVGQNGQLMTGPGCRVQCSAVTNAGRPEPLSITVGGAVLSGRGEQNKPIAAQIAGAAPDDDGISVGRVASNVGCRPTENGYQCEDGGDPPGKEDWNDLIVTCATIDGVPDPAKRK